jgi:hypothetical protein
MKSNTLIHSILSSSIAIKISALAMGYSLWFYTGQLYPSSCWIEVPLCFYNIPAHVRIQAPETVHIKLTGKRMHLRDLDLPTLAIHVNAQKFTPGKQAYHVTHYDLFLPGNIQVTACKPSVVALTIEPIS